MQINTATATSTSQEGNSTLEVVTDDACVSDEPMTSHCNRSRDESTAVIKGDDQSNLVVTSTDESGNECEEDSISVELLSCRTPEVMEAGAALSQ